ncbi:MAG: alkaline phosphatase family protein [Planctomycetia bacterium]|nr:alkaline phosphatase family protein [Planctomycetia bacterium]
MTRLHVVCGILLSFIAGYIGCGAAPRLSAAAAAADDASRPRLLVVVSIDQFPFEYLLRMRKGFAADGFFNTIARDGATYANAHHGQAFTLTGPGHSVLCSGAYPNTTGIIDNDWFDRETGKTMYCVADSGTTIVGAAGKSGMSPKNLEVGTIGDQLKLASNGRSKVVGVALKDRASILMAGHAADGAYWYDPNSGHWVTSTYYRPRLPDYLEAYNATGQTKRYSGGTWDLSAAPELYERYYADDAPFEANLPVLGRAFPHPLPTADDNGFAKLITTSPRGSEMTLAVARLVLTEEKLGLDDDTDLLCVNLSSNDYVGHAFGPYSLEVQDMTYRTDRLLGEFIQFLDLKVGAGRWTLALSSDHGVAPVPEHAVTMKLPARRVSSEHFAALRARIEAALSLQFGTIADGKKKYVQSFDSSTVYLDRGLAELQGEHYAAAQRIVRDIVTADDAVAIAFTRDELVRGGNETELFHRMTLAFYARRSGDVLYCLKPYYIAGSTTATHGSPWEYDTHVPVLLLGAGIQAGRFDRMVSPPMIAPTLARIAKVDAPSGCTVEVLQEALGGR